MARAKVFQVAAILAGISPRPDGGMSLRFVTNEIENPRDKTKLMSFYNNFGWLFFSDQSIHAVPKEPPKRDAGAKTHAQRVRASLYVLWLKKYNDVPFDQWADAQWEKIIAKIQGSIDAV